MNFHNLQANDAVFNYEYNRVQEVIKSTEFLDCANHMSTKLEESNHYSTLLVVEENN